MNSLEKTLIGVIFSIGLSLIAGLAALAFGGSFFFWSIITFIYQIVAFAIVNNIITFISKLKVRQWEIDILKEAKKNKIHMNCASCNELNEIVVNTAEDNKFICKDCGVENSVIVQIMNAQKTNPIYRKDVLTTEDIKSLKDELKDEIKFDDE